jgi:AcrR family transcriptional regulator
MRTAPDRPPGDLTARARIRDAALEVFAAHGVAGATIRGIAERADVSPALVQHHFGTKAGLREACDEHVLSYLRHQVEAGIDGGRLRDAEYLAALDRTAAPLLRYLARALVDGSPAAATVFDDLVSLTERYLVDRDGLSDTHTRAVVFTAMRLGATVLHEHVSRALGVDMFHAIPSIGLATLDIIAPEVIPDGLADQVRAGIDSFRNRRGTDDDTVDR